MSLKDIMSPYEYQNYLELISTENGHVVKPVESNVLSKDFSRRNFLKGTGMLVVGFSLSGASKLATGGSTAEAAGRSGAATAAGLLADPAIDQVDSYLVIGADGNVTFYTSKVDMGQGTMTGFMQIAAEDLDVSFARMRAVIGDTGRVPNNGGTLGSNAISGTSPTVRRAAAAARSKLLELAAQRFSVTVDKLSVKDGVISVVGDPTKSVTYAQLIAGKRFDVKFDANVKTKPVDQYKIVGQPIARVDVPTKLTGEYEYVHDVLVPGMLHARSVRPRGQSLSWLNPGPNKETGPFSVLQSVDDKSVAGVKGLVKVVPVGDMGNKTGFGGQFNFVGVVCDREEQAIEAARKLKVTWATPPQIPADLYDLLIKTPATDTVSAKGGDVQTALAGATKVLQAQYKFPFQMHASIGAVCAVADVRGDKATIWSSTQNTYGTRTSVASALGVPEENVTVIWRSGAGSYGNNNGQTIIAVDAALLSRAVGRPVRVQWFREDTHGWESYGPIHLFNLKVGLDSSNKISAYDFEVFGSTVNGPSAGTRYTFATGSAVNYRLLQHNFTTFFLTAPLRAPNAPATTFATESFLDEMAAAVKMDPIQFRLNHLDPAVFEQQRVRDVLTEASKLFKWENRSSPNPANASNRTGIVRGRGIGYGGFSSTHVATIVEVEVNQATGSVRVIRAAVAHDAGLIINPESIRQQIEGNTVQATGRALWEEVKHDGYRVSTLDWQGYPIARFGEIPNVESVLINRPATPSTGVGEPATVPIPAAIGNAIFDATGARIRQVPFTPERVLAALKAR